MCFSLEQPRWDKHQTVWELWTYINTWRASESKIKDNVLSFTFYSDASSFLKEEGGREGGRGQVGLQGGRGRGWKRFWEDGEEAKITEIS